MKEPQQEVFSRGPVAANPPLGSEEPRAIEGVDDSFADSLKMLLASMKIGELGSKAISAAEILLASRLIEKQSTDIGQLLREREMSGQLFRLLLEVIAARDLTITALECKNNALEMAAAEEKLGRIAFQNHVDDLKELYKLTATNWILELREEIERRRKAELISDIDPLTEVARKEKIIEALVNAHIEANLLPPPGIEEQRQTRGVGVIVADIDYFKSINDTYGHDVGDQILAEFSRRLRESVRGGDAIGRYGGEEFLIVISGCNDPDIAIRKAEVMRTVIEALPFVINAGGKQKEIYITASFGVSIFKPPSDETPTTLFTQADDALYATKHHGRNDVYFNTGSEIIAALPSSGRPRRDAFPQQILHII